jgi:hypothetical protein
LWFGPPLPDREAFKAYEIRSRTEMDENERPGAKSGAERQAAALTHDSDRAGVRQGPSCA